MSVRCRTASYLVAASLIFAAPFANAAPYTAAAVPFGFTDISGTGTVIAGLTGADDASVSVALPFSFNFYGASFSSIFVSSNALLTFGTGNTAFTNTDLTSAPTQASIAAFWDDLLVINPPGNVFFQTIGPVGARQFFIQWNQLRFFSGGTASDTLTFEAILFEGTGNIRFNYLDLVSGTAPGNNGASATVGIKDVGPQGSDRLLLAFNNGPNAFVGTGQSTLITAVPEPASLALLGLGLAGMVALRGRRSRRTAAPSRRSRSSPA